MQAGAHTVHVAIALGECRRRRRVAGLLSALLWLSLGLGQGLGMKLGWEIVVEMGKGSSVRPASFSLVQLLPVRSV